MGINEDLENHHNANPTPSCDECGANLRLAPKGKKEKAAFAVDHKVFHGEAPMESGKNGWVHEPADIDTEDLHSHQAVPSGHESIEQWNHVKNKADEMVATDKAFKGIVQNTNLNPKQFGQ